MNDMIYRQDALDALEWKWAGKTAIDAIKELPSAEPQIIRCKDCKHSYDDIGGTYCSYGVCVDCVVEEEFFCRDGERREEE